MANVLKASRNEFLILHASGRRDSVHWRHWEECAGCHGNCMWGLLSASPLQHIRFSRITVDNMSHFMQ